MTPTFGMSRPHADITSQSLRRPHGAPPMTPPTAIDPVVNLSFNVPFSSTLAGPDVEDVLHANPGALQRWSFAEGTPEGTPVHKLPIHVSNVEALRRLCRQITEASGGRVEASVTSSEPKSVPSLQRRPQGLVTNVCVTGDGDTVRKMRGKILNETPILLVCDQPKNFAVLPSTFADVCCSDVRLSTWICISSWMARPKEFDPVCWNIWIPSPPIPVRIFSC